ncbi:hypothetical protein Sros01_22130 [Streptomyces roseochromogenus]|nr:hypothetical protein Sros01_22130 [Streptomyces roseochromogenus]
MRDDPVQAVPDALRVGCRAALGGGRQTECRGDDAVPAAEDVAPLLLAQGGERRLDQLAHDVERDLLLLLAAACEQHGAATVGRVPAGLAEQGGLAYAARPCEGQHASAAGGRTGVRDTEEFVHRAMDRQNFGFPFEEGRGGPPSRFRDM